MKIENQVCSLELAKKLKELGFKQESLFIYFYDGDGWSIRYWNEPIPANIAEKNSDFIYSAYTVAELGEMLYKNILAGDNVLYSIECVWTKNKPIIRYFNEELLKRLASEIDNTEANARAKMLIYLKENNLI